MGFGAKWMKWVSECYSTARLSVLINGSPAEEFPMERGLRQGDLLSPSLFLIAAEGLTRIINKAVQEGLLSGLEWSKNGVCLTHLQFADDTILFYKADLQEVQNLKAILESFAICSGLTINYGKSMCLGVGIDAEQLQTFANELGCPMGSVPLSYLGMQVGCNPGRLTTWKPILQKFKNKLASWRSANLSMAGRVVLIKSALSNLPLYYASLYKMPVMVAQVMEKIQRQFLWGSSENRKKTHYVKWSKITRPKKYGGLGIQGMIEKNMVLLSKWWWKLISGKGGLWRRMILEKYAIKGPHDPKAVSLHRSKLSNSWRDILKTVQGNSEVALAFREGLKLKLGCGREVKFWYDEWMGIQAIKDQYPKLFLLAEDKQAVVSDMGSWSGGIWQWHLRFRRGLYQWEELNKLELLEGLKHIQLKEHENDKMVWSYSPDGIFSTNSLMKAAMSIRGQKKKWVEVPFQLWSGLAPPKVELLIWRIYLDSLPSKVTLQRRRILRNSQDLNCVLCEREAETTDHLLNQCRWSWELWCSCLRWWGATWVFPQSVQSLLESWVIEGTTKSYKRIWKILCYAIIWSIWEERNKRCFQDKKRTVEEICELVKVRVAWWTKYRSKRCPYTVSTITRCIEEVRNNY
ncbi:hypothetical protein QQ045_015055 [Rhodiola kirilowii]